MWFIWGALVFIMAPLAFIAMFLMGFAGLVEHYAKGDSQDADAGEAGP